MNSFPNDDDGDALRKLQAQGVDLKKPRVMEFSCDAADMSVAQRIAARLNLLNFSCRIQEASAASSYPKPSVYIRRRMVPSYEAIVSMQRELDDLLAEFETHCDGWGTLVHPAESRDT